MDIAGVLFDLGSVLVEVDVDAFEDLASLVGQPADALTELLVGDYAANGDHPYHRAERGELTLANALDVIEVDTNAAGFSLAPIRSTLLDPAVTVNHHLVAEVRRLRGAGVRTGMITNSVIEYIDKVDTVLPHDELFDVVLDSCRVGIRKPDPRIFEMALDALGLAPHDVLFVDDAPGNIAAAATLGMHTILADDFSRVAEQVRIATSTAPDRP